MNISQFSSVFNPFTPKTKLFFMKIILMESYKTIEEY